MFAWIPITIAAALAQTFRFVLQKKLAGTGFSTGGATFARFVYAAPLVICLALVYAEVSDQALPNVPPAFLAYAAAGGLAQILATMCVVALFSMRNFAVGITFKKTEVLMSVAVGFAVLGEGVSVWGLAAILVGFVGVILLSDPPGDGGGGWSRFFNRAAGLGLASGLMFAISGVGYRGASLSLGGGDTFMRAVFTLACVATFQMVIMAVWLRLRETGEITKVMRAWRVAGLVGITSLIGSLCWFTAFTLQTVAYVNALGQVELIFSMMASVLIFGERISRREVQGLVLLSGSVLALVLVV